jgi:hypothetical protein
MTNVTNEELQESPSTEVPGYETMDINLAAYLMVRGVPMQGSEPAQDEPWKRVFKFPAEARDAVPDYLAGGLIPARAYARALRAVKSMLHRQYRWTAR